jgi:hypothetical protein
MLERKERIAFRDENWNHVSFNEVWICRDNELHSAVYESTDVVLPRDHRERIIVEQHCLAREVVNLVGCESRFFNLTDQGS